MHSKTTTGSNAPRAALYLRVSTARQGEEGQSFSVQEERCRACAAAKGASVTALYQDEYSGRSTNRPGFQQMLADLHDGKADMVIVYKLDRAFRSVPDFFAFVKTCDNLGVAFVSATEDIDTGTAAGRLMRTVLAALAEFYSDLLSERMKDSMSARARSGQYCGGPVPFGYRSAGNRQGIDPDPEKAPLVKEMFQRYVHEEMTSNAISRELRARGYKIDKRQVLQVLHNPVYLGKQVWGGTIFPAQHEALVDEKTFDLAAARLTENAGSRRGPRRTIKASYKYLLDGLVRCGFCDAHMTTSTGKGRAGILYPYYRCVNETRGIDCRQKAINARELDNFVAERIAALALDPSAAEKADLNRQRTAGTRAGKLKLQRSAYSRELIESAARVEALMDMASRGLVRKENQAAWNADLSRWESARAAAKARCDAVDVELKAAEESRKQPHAMKDLFLAVAERMTNPDSHARREAIRTLIRRVIVTQNHIELDLWGIKEGLPGSRFAREGGMVGHRTPVTNIIIRYPVRRERGKRVTLSLAANVPDERVIVKSELVAAPSHSY